MFLSGGYQLDVIPEVGPVCVHVCAWGKVSSLPGPQRILAIADPSCRFFTLYLELYQLICFSPEVSASWCPEVTTALTAGLTPLPNLRFSALKEFSISLDLWPGKQVILHLQLAFQFRGSPDGLYDISISFFLLNV